MRGGDEMLRVMLVDDEQWCLEELADFLTDTGGAEISGAHLSGREALACAEREKPDIAFIDVLMPGMTGLELAKKLKARLPAIRVVLISEDESYARYGFDIGVDDFILKPVRSERVRKALERGG
jgi:YesN/AraC family two-component response regulator